MITSTLCVALAVYYEARSEPLEYQYLVADSIHNRVNEQSSEFGLTACDVVRKGYAEGRWPMVVPDDSPAWQQARAVAWAKQDGFSPNPAPDVLWYHTSRTDPPYWAQADYICGGGTVGAHTWYKRCEP